MEVDWGLLQGAELTGACVRSAPQQGCTFVNQYVVIKTLGQGAYGKVKLCLNAEDHGLYALKLISKARARLSCAPSRSDMHASAVTCP